MNWGALLVGAIILVAVRAQPDRQLGKAVLLLGVFLVLSNIVAWFFFRQSAGTLIEVLTMHATQGFVRAGSLSAGYAFVLSGLISIAWGSITQLSGREDR